MANDIQSITRYNKKPIDKVFKVKRKSSVLDKSKPKFRKKRIK